MRARVPTSRDVNLLLLLSALLSALTGATAGARAPQVTVAVSRTAASVVAAQVKPVRTAGAPIAALPALIDVAVVYAEPAWTLKPSAPLYQSRRRE